MRLTTANEFANEARAVMKATVAGKLETAPWVGALSQTSSV